MYRLEPAARYALPLLAAACGAVLFAISPLSHQAFCAPLSVQLPLEAVVIPGGAE